MIKHVMNIFRVYLVYYSALLCFVLIFCSLLLCYDINMVNKQSSQYSR